MEIQDILNKKHFVLGDGIGYVELIDIMGDEMDVVRAARVSTQTETIGNERDIKLLKYLWNNRHTSPFEQVELKFRFKAPITTVIQWMRHRTWDFVNFNQESARYTEVRDEFYYPLVWRRQSKTNKQGSQGEINSADALLLDKKIRDLAQESYTLYLQALEMGVAKEQARYFLPTGIQYTSYIAKVNLWNLLWFIDRRTHEGAQWEIQQYANRILYEVIQPLFPNIFLMIQQEILYGN